MLASCIGVSGVISGDMSDITALRIPCVHVIKSGENIGKISITPLIFRRHNPITRRDNSFDP